MKPAHWKTKNQGKVNPGYQTKMARAILDGIKRYFAQNPALSRQKMAQIE